MISHLMDRIRSVHSVGKTDECIMCFYVAEEMCPISEKEIVIMDSVPWYNNMVDRDKKGKEEDRETMAQA